jgi:hypothetical protein
MTIDQVVCWAEGSSHALFGGLWLFHETRERASSKQDTAEKAPIWVLGGGAAAVTLFWELCLPYFHQPKRKEQAVGAMLAPVETSDLAQAVGGVSR